MVKQPISPLDDPIQKESLWDQLKLFLNPFDARYEEMTRDNWYKVALRDISAGLLVAMMAIPMAMGFAIASGLSWEMGGESGRTRSESDMSPWRTARGAAGRMPPSGFPRDGRFGSPPRR